MLKSNKHQPKLAKKSTPRTATQRKLTTSKTPRKATTKYAAHKPSPILTTSTSSIATITPSNYLTFTPSGKSQTSTSKIPSFAPFSKRNLQGTWKPAPGTPGYVEADEHQETLNKFCTELTTEAKEGRLDPMIGRLDILARCVEALSRRRKNSPILTGEPGTGKTAIIEGLAQAIVSGQVPEQLRGKKIYSLDLAQLVAGATYRGEFEERLTKLINALEAKQDAILFVDEVHLLAGAGKTEGAMDAANMLKPALARGKIKFMGATTTKEYTQHIEKDGALARRFETIHVPEPSIQDCITILRGLKPKYEAHHKVLYRDSAIVAAAQMAKRYFTERRLPDKAIDLLDESGAHINLIANAKPKSLTSMEQDYFRLKMELESLTGDNDSVAVMRRNRIQQRMEKCKQKLDKKEQEWKFAKTLQDEAREAEQHAEETKEQVQRMLNIQRTSTNLQERKHAEERLAALASIHVNSVNTAKSAKEKYDAYLRSRPEGEEQTSTDVTSDVIARVVAQHTGVPVSKLLVKDKEKLLNLEDELRKRVVAQDHALTAVSTCVRVARAGLHNGQRPQGVFLFCGPSGVGKSELCKALAENLFGSSEAMVRLDMSEYSEAHSVSRLIGAAPGYVGYEEGGQLTEAVRKKPYQVVLLDEIEKAHKQVHTVLLQIMEEANLTDGKGHKVDFSNTIFIMTSNLGAHEAQQYKSLNPHLDSRQLANEIMTKAVKQYFPPEFVNRLDDTIFFNSLGREHMNAIVRIQMDKVSTLLDDHNSSLVASPAIVNDLGDRGFQPEYGARPVKRAIYRNVTQVLAEGILAGIIENHSLVTMRMRNEPEVIPSGYELESSQGVIINDAVKSADPTYVFTVYKKKIQQNKREDRFSWESDDELELTSETSSEDTTSSEDEAPAAPTRRKISAAPPRSSPTRPVPRGVKKNDYDDDEFADEAPRRGARKH